MNVLLALVVGAFFAAALYLMMRRSIVKLVIGLALLSHAANLLIFASGGITRGEPPLIPASGVLSRPIADPLPQALILTAIVISFAVLAFTLVLIHRTHDIVGTDDLDMVKEIEE